MKRKPLVETPPDVMKELMRLDRENEELKEIIFQSKTLTYPKRRSA